MANIKEISEELQLTAYTIRYYESEGLIAIPRDKQGNRLFGETEVERLRVILHYRNVGMSLQNIKKIFDNSQDREISLELLTQTKKRTGS